MMYDKFTDRARKTMQLANQEAQRLCHEYIGTEHILLGLIKEGSGVAANVLKNLDIDLRRVRMEVERIIQAGPDCVIMGKLPNTPRAQKVLEYAVKEAEELRHNYVGTEHLLLGMIREGEGVAAEVFRKLNVKQENVRQGILNLVGGEKPNVGCDTATGKDWSTASLTYDGVIMSMGVLPDDLSELAALWPKLPNLKAESMEMTTEERHDRGPGEIRGLDSRAV
jgi:ATP-dependent Clp protease ATP-binding subunit ClpA